MKIILKFFVISFSALFLVACVDKTNVEMNLVIEAAKGDITKVQEYAAKLDSVNFVSSKGDTPLGAAAHNGNMEVVKFLIKSGASADYKNEEGKSAMDIAKEKGHDGIYKYLFDQRQ